MAEVVAAPLIMNGIQARCGIKDTDWPGLGIGEPRFRRLVKAGARGDPGGIPSWKDPDTKTRSFHKLALIEWSKANGVAS